MLGFQPLRSTVLLALAIALNPSAAPAQDGETLILNGTFNMSKLVPTVGADLAGVYAADGAHRWRLTLEGVTYSNDFYTNWPNDYGSYRYEAITRVHATSFTLEFFGPNAAMLNQIVSGQLGGGGFDGGAFLELKNVEDDTLYGYYKTWGLSLAPLNAAGVSFEAYRFDFGSFPSDENWNPLIPQQIQVDNTFIDDRRNGANGWLQSSGDVVSVGDHVACLVSVADASVAEGDKGTTTLFMTVMLTSSNTGTVTVNYNTADGTAFAGSDYVKASGTLTFKPGETSKTIAVTIKSDRKREPNKTFRVLLSNAFGAIMGRSVGTATIVNDD